MRCAAQVELLLVHPTGILELYYGKAKGVCSRRWAPLRMGA
ncbi:FABP family protein [Humibacillus sp. DSM 29435]|nr:FABP family protein [Humibacillus sp. DSM 29435]